MKIFSSVKKKHKQILPIINLLNNPTAAIVTVLAIFHKVEGFLILGNIQSML